MTSFSVEVERLRVRKQKSESQVPASPNSPAVNVSGREAVWTGSIAILRVSPQG